MLLRWGERFKIAAALLWLYQRNHYFSLAVSENLRIFRNFFSREGIVTGGNSFLFASFFRLQTEKIVLGYNNDKIVLAISKNSRFAKIHSLLKYNQKEKTA